MNFRSELSGSIDLFKVHLAAPERFPFLLESLAAHPASGRYDVLFGCPEQALRGADGWRALRDEVAATPMVAASELPFSGGWFVLVGYEAARFFEPGLRLPASPYPLSDFLAVRCRAAIIVDRDRQRTILLAEEDAAQLDLLRDALRTAAAIEPESGDATPAVEHLEEEPADRFIDGVARIQDYLRAGDCFQVNLSRRWRAELRPTQDYRHVYARLRQRNPAPFAGLARFDDVAVLSSSPERLVQVADGWVQTRPIAGTRPRGSGAADDLALQRQLLGSLKERAEHVMLIDLERNDLGRVCRPGSIEVSELMALESYAHVHHIVSNVRGRLQTGRDALDTLSAVFPGGTITGCPKLRAMEIIAELEGIGRGPYTGAMGYLSRCGRLDTNILIRTLVVHDGQAYLRAGAGIVADSQAEAELAETRIKARGLLLALGLS